jgi:putative hydrolase of the HAD superfamily
MTTPDLRNVTTLTFDVVGTVIDFERGILEWWQPHLHAQGVERDDATVLRTFAAAEDRLQREHPEWPFTSMLPAIYNDIAAAWGLDGGEEAARAFQASIAHWPPFPDSVAALRMLGRQYRLVAVTNADACATSAMDSTAGNLFDDRVTCDEVGVNKPDPKVFQHVLQKLGLKRTEVLHFAQSQYHDIGAATAFGLKTAWVERRHGHSDGGATPGVVEAVIPDVHVHSLAQLAEILVPNQSVSG